MNCVPPANNYKSDGESAEPVFTRGEQSLAHGGMYQRYIAARAAVECPALSCWCNKG
jgi:hypothetical protein